ncbi:MAG: NUDIX domain-containing protein [Gemmatimonadetes bacterium]|nr:NUDIX domain-containing protein [Gemmatimonadota bacterium]
MRIQRSTSAGVVVFFRRADGGLEILLLLSRLTKRPLWEFPKGGVQPGETTLQAALRELAEETGLSAADIRLVPGFEWSESYRFNLGDTEPRTLVRKHVTYYLAEAFRRDVRIAEAETSAYAWLPLPEAVRRVRYPGRRRMLRAAAALLGMSPEELGPPARDGGGGGERPSGRGTR